MIDLEPYAPAPAFEDISVGTADGVGWVLLNRPAVSNAVRPQTMREICEALDLFTADPAVDGIILSGNGKNFLAGADFEFLQGLASSTEDETRTELYTYFKGAAERLWRCPKPTVAAVNGAAITVGCELALMCDFRVVIAGTVFQEPWLRLGLIAPLGGAVLLPRYVGLDLANRMLLGGESLSGEAAVRAGLASELVEPEQLRIAAQARIKKVIALPRDAYGRFKAAIRRGIESTMDAEWTANIATQAELLSGGIFRERLDAASKARKT